MLSKSNFFQWFVEFDFVFDSIFDSKSERFHTLIESASIFLMLIRMKIEKRDFLTKLVETFLSSDYEPRSIAN